MNKATDRYVRNILTSKTEDKLDTKVLYWNDCEYVIKIDDSIDTLIIDRCFNERNIIFH